MASRHPFSVLPDEKGSDNNPVKRRKNGKNHVQLFKTFLFMKTNKFWFVMAAAAMLAGTTMMTSCEKEEEISKREVIDSEVLDEGVAEKVTEEVGTEGTQLSYESWIVVRGQTRAAFQNKVSVTLNNRLNNVSREIEVESWETGEAEISYGYKAGDSRKNGDYVTVTDSVMVCTVSYPGFSFDYELLYQVAVYDDHVTRQVMPYHKYENIVDNGCELSELEDASENGVTYKRQKCVHSLTVTFNGKEYKVSSELILKKAQKGEDKLLAAKVVNEGIEFVKTGDWSGKTVSWILIEQTWSESGTKQARKEVVLYNEQLESTGAVTGVLGKMLGKDDFAYEAEVVDEAKELGRREEDGFAVVKYGYEATVRLKDKTTGASLSFSPYELTYETAVYKDEFVTYEMPANRFHDPQTSLEVGEWREADGMYVLDVETRFSLMFGDATYETNDGMSFFYEPNMP